MISFLKKIFSKKDDGMLSLTNELSFDRAFEFSKFNIAANDKLLELLINLKEKKNKFTIEKSLRKKQLYKSFNVSDIINEISKDWILILSTAKKNLKVNILDLLII